MISKADRKYGIIPPYKPFESEIEGLKRIVMGTQIVFAQVSKGFKYCTDFENVFWDGVYGVCLTITGVYQLGVPIVGGIGTYAAYKLYKNV